jgi:SAM-dependent methyltransferase
MAQDEHDGHLGAVYQARQPEEIAALYDAWAGDYEAEMSAAGYRHPTICLALLARHLPGGSGPILDAGAGTGLLGEWLGLLGFRHVEGLDISQGMLAIAAQKGSYAALHHLALGPDLPLADGQFAGVISSGVFTTGHVGAEALPELIRITRPGGVIVLTVKMALWEAGFGAEVDRLIRTGAISIAEETPPYVSMPGVAGTSPSKGLVLKVA